MNTSRSDEQPILNAINQSFSYEHEEPDKEETAPVAPQASYPQLSVSQPPAFRPIAQQAAQPQVVVQRPPVYNTVGVPIQQVVTQPMQVTIDLPSLQKQVKCWSRFLIVVSYLLMISGAIKVFTNMIFFFNMGGFSRVSWYDKNGNYRTIIFNQGCLSLMAILSVVVGVLTFKQGKITKRIFAPILKEYRLAESGQTNGIPMTKRRAPKMHWLKRIVKKITCGFIGVTILTLMVCKKFALDVVNQVVSQEYELMERKNQTFADFNIDPQQFWINQPEDQQPVFHPFKFDDDLDFEFTFETDDDIFKQIKEDDIFKMLGNKNETSIVTPYFNTTEVEEPVPEVEETAVQPVHENKHHGKKHHGKHQYKHHQKHPKNMMKNGFKWDMHKMTKDECLYKANMFISGMMAFCGFWGIVGICFWQGLFICAINQVKKPQSTLEKTFMGPEPPRTCRRSCRQAPQQPQGTIQYIVAQPNQVQPDYLQQAPQIPVQTGNIARANTFE